MPENLSDKLQRDIDYRAHVIAVALMGHLRTACPHDKYKAYAEMPGQVAAELGAFLAHLIDHGVIREVER